MLKLIFKKPINLVKELKRNIDEYKKNIAKRYNSTFLMQLYDYQLRFLRLTKCAKQQWISKCLQKTYKARLIIHQQS